MTTKQIAGAVILILMLVVAPIVAVAIWGTGWYLLLLGYLIFGGVVCLGWLVFFSGGRDSGFRRGMILWTFGLAVMSSVGVPLWLDYGTGWQLIVGYIVISPVVALFFLAYYWLLGEEGR